MKWSVAEPRDRTISPFSEITVSEWLEDRAKSGTLNDLRAGVRVDPVNPRLVARLGRGLADHAQEKGIDPGEVRRARAEADFQIRRAVKLAPDDEEVNKLRAEVVQLLQPSSE